MSSTVEVVESRRPLFDECRDLLQRQQSAFIEIGQQFDQDTLDHPLAPEKVERIIQFSPAKMRKHLRLVLSGKKVNPIRERRALAMWKEKKVRTHDANRKRYTRAWDRRHREPVSPPQRLSDGRHPDSTWTKKFDDMMQETRKRIESRGGLGFIPQDEAIALAGRVILMACLVTDPNAGRWTPRLTEWQDLPWESWHNGEQLDGRLWGEVEVAKRMHETRRLLMGLMFHRHNAEKWVPLLKKAMKTWKRLVPQASSSSKPLRSKTWQEVLPLMERHIEAHGFTNYRELAAAVGCSPALIAKIKHKSTKLKAAVARKKHRKKVVPLSPMILDNAVQTTEASPDADRDAELQHLVAEQTADDLADRRTMKARRRR